MTAVREKRNWKFRKRKIENLAKLCKNDCIKICACVIVILAIILIKLFPFYFPQTDTIFIKNMKHYVHISVTVLKLKSETLPRKTAMPQTKSEKQ